MTEVHSLKAAIDKLAIAPADEDAWRLLYHQMWPFVIAIAYRRLKDRAAAEDVAQEVLMQVLRSRPFEKIREESAFRAYVWRMALNAVNTRLRNVVRDDKGQRRLFELRTAEHAGVAAQRQDDDDRVLMEEALQLVMEEELDPGDREFLQRLLQGDSLGEAAAALNLSYSNAGVRYFRLKRKLRKLLTGNEK